MSNNIRLKLSMLIIIGFIYQFILLSWPEIAVATVNDATWSWTETKPSVSSSTVVTDMATTPCFNSYQMKDVVGESDPKRVCIMTGDNVKFGNYFVDGRFAPIISFAYDSKMYKIRGACDRSDSCLYLPGSDTLVTKQYLINGIVRSLVVYKDFTHRLARSADSSVSATEYNFDSSNPDYIFRSADGYAWPVGGIGASDDGEWLAIEFRQRGIGLLNIETLEMKRVSTMAFNYGMGFDPTSELAVSNDGGHIAVMGMNSGLTVLDVNSACGDEATDERMSSVASITQPCRTAQIDTGDFINRFFAAINPKFNDEGGELNFYAMSYLGESREVSLRAGGYVSPRLDYLALGDSFTSGEGETDDKYYLNGTNDEYEKCHVSMRSYPFLISDSMKIDPLSMASVACSGATMGDVVGDDLDYLGQSDRLGKNKLNLVKTDRVLAQTEARNSFLPGRVHQGSFVEKYQPEVMTVGIGGNDVGFMEKLKTCLTPGICNWASTDEGKEKTADEIKNLFSTLVQTYQKLHKVSPNSKIYAIGYPKIIDATGQCNLLNGYLLDSTERQFMNEGIVYLNEVIMAAAKATGIKYIDIQNSYGDYVLCGKSQPSAMNAIRLGDDGAINDRLKWFKPIGNESFHPNSLGHTYMANSIIESLGNIVNYDYCAGGNIVCPNPTIAAPEPSSYWIPDGYHNYPMQKTVDYVSDRDDATDNRQKKLMLDSNSLAPDSSVDVEITSDIRSLGQFLANHDGSLNVNVDLPTDLEEGYHTVHLYGTSYSGELVELYQVIEYEKPHAVPSEELTLINRDDDDTAVVNNTEHTIESVAKVNIKIQPSTANNIGKNSVAKSFADAVIPRSSIKHSINTDVATSYNSSEPAVKGTSIIAHRSPLSVKEDVIENPKEAFVYNLVVTFWVLLAVVGALAIGLVYKTRG